MLAKEASMLAHGGIPVGFGGKLSCNNGWAAVEEVILSPASPG